MKLLDDLRARRGSDSAGFRTLLAALGGAVLGALAAFLLDPERGRSRRARYADQAAAAVRRAAAHIGGGARAVGATIGGRMSAARAPASAPPQLNDAALAQKVESQLFRNRDALKAGVNINVEGGVLVLRGAVPDARTRRALEERAARIEGVWSVRSLLRLPGEPLPEALVRNAG